MGKEVISTDFEGTIKLTTLEQAYAYLDLIPIFELNLGEIYEVQTGVGHIPKLGHWFWPENEKGFESESKIDNIANSPEFNNWGPRRVIDSNRLEWREKYHAVAYFCDKEAKRVIDGWGEGVDSKFGLLRNQNIDNNVVRLLTHKHSPACRDFALLCMRYVPDMTEKQIHQLFPTIGGDGDAGAQFWTVAPYILEALKNDRFTKGMEENDREDFFRILMWSKARLKTGSWGYDAIYPGLGELGREIRGLYLPRDGFHPIHKFVGRIGAHVASYLEKISVDEKIVLGDDGIRRFK